ncbi:MAG: DUF2284 domain-containing protein [Candidatus Helarchaeota archaeon]
MAKQQLEKEIDIKEKIEALKKHALKIGAVQALEIDPKEIILDARTRLKCYSGCEFHSYHHCPPHTPSLPQFRTLLEKSKGALIVIVKEPALDMYDDDEPSQKMGVALTLSKRQLRIIHELESKARNEMDLNRSRCYQCGPCIQCGILNCNKAGKCRHPKEARASMEAMGINVIDTLKKIGVEIEIPPKNELTWVGMILLN